MTYPQAEGAKVALGPRKRVTGKDRNASLCPTLGLSRTAGRSQEGNGPRNRSDAFSPTVTHLVTHFGQIFVKRHCGNPLDHYENHPSVTLSDTSTYLHAYARARAHIRLPGNKKCHYVTHPHPRAVA